MSNSEERDALLQQFRSKNRTESLSALEAIKARGWLQDGTLRGAYLYGAKWQNMDLTGADLRDCTLSGIVLENATLTDANFSGAEMIDCNMKGVIAKRAAFVGVDAIAAKLHNADLTDADMRGMTLGNATLSFTRFHHTQLADIDFNNAILDNTIFADVDLSGVRNLDTVRHYAPSAIDTATLVQSTAVESDFWRGCGINESLIAALPALRATADTYHPVYISYTYPDRLLAWGIQKVLRAAGVRCWLHEHQIERDVDFYKRMNLGMRSQDRVIVVTSAQALHSWWIAGEVDAAAVRAHDLANDAAPSLICVTVAPNLADTAPESVWQGLQAYPHYDFSAIQDEDTFVARVEEILVQLKR